MSGKINHLICWKSLRAISANHDREIREVKRYGLGDQQAGGQDAPSLIDYLAREYAPSGAEVSGF